MTLLQRPLNEKHRARLGVSRLVSGIPEISRNENSRSQERETDQALDGRSRTFPENLGFELCAIPEDTGVQALSS